MSTKRHHTEWLSLIEVSGPFLTMPALEKVFPQGLDAHDPDHARNLRVAFDEWETNQTSQRPNPAIHRAWIGFVLKQTLALPEEVIAAGQVIPQTLKATVSEHGETLRPDIVVRNPKDAANPEKPRLLVHVYPVEQDLEKPVAGRHWKASPGTRMMELLHATDIRLGLVTNGEHWMLVDAPRGDTTGFASWYATLWLEEPLTLRAFRSLLGVHRFFAVADDQTLEAMLKESAKYQNEVTDQLGLQVRHAVEVLIQSLDRADQDHGRQLLADVPETVLYEAALTVMMRLVFLFSAEERGLLLLGDPLYDQHYAVSTLVAQLQEAADHHGEEVLERRFDAWVRLLSTFRAVFGGVRHERMKLPAYAGNLFNPDRFPFLEGRRGTRPASAPGGEWSWRNQPANPLPVNNRTVLHLLRSLQYLEMQGEARRLSFRALDIEQIGRVYEGLLDHTAKRADEPMLGVLGAKGNEPEVPLAELERLASRVPSGPGSSADLVKFLAEETGRQEKSLKRGLETPFEGEDAKKLKAACGTDEKLFARVRPYSGLLRNDTFGRPVVIRKGSVFVTTGTDRRSTGTHYTPRSLTEPIVQYTLEPLVYEGPAEGKPKEEWKLRSAKELLDLKICDMACGSGAFLVQACRYMAERLVEAWEDAEKRLPSRDASAPGLAPGITPYGELSTGAASEQLIPKETNERLVYAQRIVTQRCLYGVDKNPLAAEMAKLSLWLLTLAKDKPFTFLDHAIRCGDSLVGIHELRQLEVFNLQPEGAQAVWYSGPVKELVKEAVELRRRLESMPSNTVADVETQAKLLQGADEKIARLRYAADMLLAVEFHPEAKSDRQFVHDSMALQAGELVASGDVEKFREVTSKALNGQPTFHWPLEFPEVMIGRGGFDAFVGNPPYLGGKRIRTELGGQYGDAIKQTVISGEKGAADLCAYFQRRAYHQATKTGLIGLVLTNSIAQGETRLLGPEAIIQAGGRIIYADPDRRWPGTASTTVSLIGFAKRKWAAPVLLAGKQVDEITSFLTAGESFGTPHELASHPAIASTGTSLNGEGFILSPEEAQSMSVADRKNGEFIQPYLVADDLNSRPDQTPSRSVINFGEMDEREAKTYREPFSRLEKLVKPMREKHTHQIHETCFWKHWDKRPNLYTALAKMKNTLVGGRVTKFVSFSLLPTGIIFSDRLVVVATERMDILAVLQSTFHAVWVERLQTSMGETLGYSVSKCFNTWPWPRTILTGKVKSLEALGETYSFGRREIMLARREGLTKTYNRFHDSEETGPDIRKLRELHVEMDKAVAAAYGWDDLDLGHDFHPTKQGVRFTISESARREVLARLLKLNHERYAEEVKQGLHDKKGKGKKASGGRSRKNSSKPAGATLFGEEPDPAEETEPEADGQPTRTTARQQARDAAERPPALDSMDTEDVMAAFRQAARGRGWLERDELLKLVSLALGYQRLGPRIDEALRGHLRAAIRRKIIEADGPLVRPGAATMEQYDLDDLRDALCSVMRKGSRYAREDVIHAVARYLGFARVTDTSRDAVRSAINSAIRQGILGYEANVVWRET
jgi:hypothetical protein